MSATGRRGLRSEPRDGWPLDGLLVGPATTRTIRELFRKHAERGAEPQRAWDLALWSGVSPQGSGNSLDRMEQFGLVVASAPGRPGRGREYRLDRSHPLARPLEHLFAREWAMVRRRQGRLTWRREERGGEEPRSRPRP